MFSFFEFVCVCFGAVILFPICYCDTSNYYCNDTAWMNLKRMRVFVLRISIRILFCSNALLFEATTTPSMSVLCGLICCVCVVERGHSLRLISLNWRQTKWKWKIKLNFRDTHCALFCFVFGLLCDCVLIHWHWCCRYHLFLVPGYILCSFCVCVYSGYEVLSLRVVRVDIFNGVVVSDLILLIWSDAFGCFLVLWDGELSPLLNEIKMTKSSRSFVDVWWCVCHTLHPCTRISGWI